MNLNGKRIATVAVALIGVAVAYSCLTKDQAAAWTAVIAAVAAAYMPQQEQPK